MSSRDIGRGVSLMLAIANICVKNFGVGNFVLQSDITHPSHDGSGEEWCVINGRTDKTETFRCSIGRSMIDLLTSPTRTIGMFGGEGLLVKFEYPNTIWEVLVIIDEETGIHIITNPRLRKLFAAVLELT